MTEQFELIEVNCAECEELVECFDDDEGFDCPYCGTRNIFVDSEDDDIPEEDDEWELVENFEDILKPGVSILWTWCRRHPSDNGRQGRATDHLWTGQRLRCLICWPSWKPKGFELREIKDERRKK
jgi:hypothetical protein